MDRNKLLTGGEISAYLKQRERDKQIEFQPSTSSFLDEFGIIERMELVKILEAWRLHGLPQDFELGEIVPMFNFDSGNVFLTNSDNQVAMLRGDKLELFYTCYCCGHEGFIEDCQTYINGGEGCNKCDKEGYNETD